MLKVYHRWFLAVVGCVALGAGACGGNDAVPLEPVTYDLSITAYNGEPGDAVALRCDGTLAVAVNIAPSNTFSLRPANACGNSPRCGYVRFEALDEDGELLATEDSATLEGVLRLPDAAQWERLHEVRVSLRSGVNGEPILNADGSEALTSAEPSFTSPSGCDAVGGAGGAGGAPSEPVGGAGGAGGAPTAELGGAGGVAEAGGAGGVAEAGGAGGVAEAGGAGNGPL